MISDNREFFEGFRKIHDRYALSQDELQDDYNKEGARALEFIREYENRLCTNTERGMYNRYSAVLAEKFQNEVKKLFPMIDHVGIIIEKPLADLAGSFQLKKITL